MKVTNEKEIAVEFADWILKNDYRKIHGSNWVKQYLSVTHSSKDLFNIFLKQRNENT